mmetsp:Transcript_102059/g.304566  ORF Transcript_102059/g.304566 Transcript_102059/m.304566 type:complete len:219 (-) Transcript_102059:1786-2442(-)
MTSQIARCSCAHAPLYKTLRHARDCPCGPCPQCHLRPWKKLPLGNDPPLWTVHELGRDTSDRTMTRPMRLEACCITCRTTTPYCSGQDEKWATISTLSFARCIAATVQGIFRCWHVCMCGGTSATDHGKSVHAIRPPSFTQPQGVAKWGSSYPHQRRKSHASHRALCPERESPCARRLPRRPCALRRLACKSAVSLGCSTKRPRCMDVTATTPFLYQG